MTYEDRQKLKEHFTTALYHRYNEGDHYIKMSDALVLAYRIIDDYFKNQEAQQENVEK